MNYLLDKKTKRNRQLRVALGIVAIVVLLYFRSGIWSGLSYAGEIIFRPVLVLGQSIGEKLGSAGSYFASKNYLYLENQDLQSRLSREEARISNYDSLLAENENLKGILGRKDTKESAILAAILSKPNQSAYDTLVVDAGAAQGVKEGSVVFAEGFVPIGRTALVYGNSSKVILFSSAGEKTQAVVSFGYGSGEAGKDVFAELVGRGGGNFEMTMPKDFTIEKGDQAVMPGRNPYLLAVAEKTISDPRDPFTKVLLVSPVNVQELKFVEIEK